MTNAPLWTWRELTAALGLPEQDGPDIAGFCIDSRRIRPGDLFIALTGDPGERFTVTQRSTRDGHDYVDAAIAAGAAGVLTHDGRERAVPRLPVADTLDALWALGAAGRARLTCPVVAITGSSGKTTTKALLAAALDGHATPGSLNNHLGVPLSLALTPRFARAAILEIGTNHPGEIAPLSELVRPNLAVVLNVHPAHRERFPDMEALRQEKLSIFKGLIDPYHLVVEDLVDTRGVPERIRIRRFGESSAADVRLLDSTGGQARYRIGERELVAEVPGGGRHRALSLGAVLCVLECLGRDPAVAARLSGELVPAGRGSVREINGVCVLDDSYNANPESMRAALLALAARPAARRFALLGEMLELGADAPDYHRRLAPHCAGCAAVFGVGDGMTALLDALEPDQPKHWQREPDDALINRLVRELRPGDVLLVKGSNRVFWARDFVGRLERALAGTGDAPPVQAARRPGQDRPE